MWQLFSIFLFKHFSLSLLHIKYSKYTILDDIYEQLSKQS